MKLTEFIKKEVLENMVEEFILFEAIYNSEGVCVDAFICDFNSNAASNTGGGRIESGKKLSSLTYMTKEEMAGWMACIDGYVQRGANEKLNFKDVNMQETYLDVTFLFLEPDFFMVISHNITQITLEKLKLIDSESKAKKLNEELKLLNEDLEKQKARYLRAEQLASVGNWEVDFRTGVIWGSDQLRDIYGLVGGIDKNRDSFDKVYRGMHPDDIECFDEGMAALRNGSDKVVMHYRIFNPKKGLRYLTSVAESIRDKSGQLIGINGTIQDTTDIAERQNQLEFLAFNDEMTGIHNRNGFTKSLKKAFKKKPKSLWVMCLDIVGINEINMTLGRKVGDEFIKKTVEKIRQALGEAYELSRTGGNQFAFVIHEKELETDIESYYESLLEKVGREITFSGYILSLEFYCAYVKVSEPTTEAEVILDKLETALHEAKTLESRKIIGYEEKFTEKIIDKTLVKEILENALRDRSFEMYYQQQISLETGNVVGFESLVRLRDRQGNIISPREFISVSEETGIIHELGKRILRQVCIEQKYIMETLPNVKTISVNISPRQLLNDNFIVDIDRIFSETGANIEMLEFEITETSALLFNERIRDVINEIRKMGVKIALDDFGTGYSMFEHLMKLSVDTVKLDKSFIENIHLDSQKREILRLMIQMLRLKETHIVAEGIEIEEELNALKELACDTIQGYYYHRPEPLDKILNYNN